MQKILVAIAAVILVVIGFSVGQAANNEVSFRTSSSDADDATANYDLNALTTDNVYQQIVVAGWGTRDMLEVIANQTDGLDRMAVAINETQRVQIQLQTVQIVLLGVLILAIVLLVPRREKQAATEAPSEIASPARGAKVSAGKTKASPSLADPEKEELLSVGQRSDWVVAGKPELSTWDGQQSFSEWLKRNWIKPYR